MTYQPNFKSHFAVIGNSGTGKGVFVSSVARRYRAAGLPVYLLTCKEDEYHSFPADFKTMRQDRFLEAVMSFRGSVERNGVIVPLGLMAVVDEAWRWKWRGELEEIPNAGRSRGIELWAQGQRYFQMPPNVRTNCENIIVFRQKLEEDIETLRRERGEAFGGAGRLNPGQYIAEIGEKVTRGTAWEKRNGVFVSI